MVMRKYFWHGMIMVAAIMLASCGSAQAQNVWKNVSPASNEFSISMPGQVEQSAQWGIPTYKSRNACSLYAVKGGTPLRNKEEFALCVKGCETGMLQGLAGRFPDVSVIRSLEAGSGWTGKRLIFKSQGQTVAKCVLVLVGSDSPTSYTLAVVGGNDEREFEKFFGSFKLKSGRSALRRPSAAEISRDQGALAERFGEAVGYLLFPALIISLVICRICTRLTCRTLR
jgi:hypothetical protein